MTADNRSELREKIEDILGVSHSKETTTVEVKEIIDLFTTEMLAVIGEDEKLLQDKSMEAQIHNGFRRTNRNVFRAELRAAVERYRGE